jgi:uncharacterized repeat protein (TIGR01451 family)
LRWNAAHVEIRTEIASPLNLTLDNNVFPGGSQWGSDDRRAVPTQTGVQIGNGPYPTGNALVTPSENWMAFWDGTADEVYGFTFNRGYKLQAARDATTPARFWVPAGTSTLSFHIVRPKSSQPHEAIRNLTSAPYLTLSNSVDMLFARADTVLTYTLTYGNSGSSQASGVQIVDTLPSDVTYVTQSASDNGTYDSVRHVITWNLGSLDVGAAERSVTFQARISSGIADGTTLANSATIACAEEPFPVTADVTTKIASPVITTPSPNPTSGGNTGTVTITIVGENFDPHAEVRLRKAGEADIVATGVSVSSDGTHLTATFDLHGTQPGGAHPGQYDVVVTNPDGQTTTLPAGFEVVQGGGAKLWVEIVGRDEVRAGRETVYEIRYGNSGNTDIVDAVVGIEFPEILERVSSSEDGIYLPPDSSNSHATILWFEDSVSANTRRVKSVTLKIPSEVPEGAIISVSGYVAPAIPEFRDGFCPEQTVATVVDPAPDLGESCEPPGRAIVPERRTVERRFPLRPLVEKADDRECRITFRCRIWKDNQRRDCTMDCGIGLAPPPNAEWISKSCDDWKLVDGRGYTDEKTIMRDCGLICEEPGSCAGGQTSTFISQVKTPVDPNGKAGPGGYDPGDTPPAQRERFVAGGHSAGYMVFFENKEEATAAAQEVLVADQLDPNLDWSTFSLGQMQIGEKTVAMPEGLQSFATVVDLRPEFSALVDVTCTFDPSTGRAQWLFRGTDPSTGELADFLPPNTDAVDPRGRGWISYSVKPKPNLPTGTVIRNKATIDFEVGIPPDPMDTPEVFNTIDADAPASQVLPLAANQASNRFEVQWSGTDVGSGVKDYTVFVSGDGGAYTAWLSNTTATSGTFPGQPGRTYAFYSVARDNVGNFEAAPIVPDAQAIAGPALCTGDCDGSSDVAISEIITMVNIALGNLPISACVAGDADGSGTVEINEIIQAVNNALNGCQ